MNFTSEVMTTTERFFHHLSFGGHPTITLALLILFLLMAGIVSTEAPSPGIFFACAFTGFCLLFIIPVIFSTISSEKVTGQYVADGAIIAVEQNNKPGQINDPYKIDVMLSNSDIASFEIPLNNPEQIDVGNAFKIESDTFTSVPNRHNYMPLDSITANVDIDGYHINLVTQEGRNPSNIPVTFTVNDEEIQY